MAGQFTLVPLREAMTSLGLGRHFENRTTLDEFRTADDRIAEFESNDALLKQIESRNPAWRESIRQNTPPHYFVRYYANHAVEAGDIDMDRLVGQDIAGIVIDGDFELHGSIENWEIDTTAAFLWVHGNLHCRNIIFGSMDLVVERNVSASGLIVATYNHGHLLINGDVHADRVIIDDDGPSVIGGRVFAKGWNSSQNAEVDLRMSEWIREVRPEFRDEFFRENGFFRCGNGNVDLVKALLAGRNILRPES